jgi:hypothetical protein
VILSGFVDQSVLERCQSESYCPHQDTDHESRGYVFLGGSWSAVR